GPQCRSTGWCCVEVVIGFHTGGPWRLVDADKRAYFRWRQWQTDVRATQGIGHRVGDAHRRAHIVALAHPLGALWGEGRWRFAVQEERFDDCRCGRHQIISEGPAEETTVLAVGELFRQRRAEALGEAATNLAIDQRRVEQAAGVMTGD